MLPFVVLDRIESEKIKYLCRTYIEGLHAKVGNYFYLYLKDFYMDEEEVEVMIGLIPKPNVIFISRFLDPKTLARTLPALCEKNFIFVDPGKNKNPLAINKYNMYKMLSPIHYKNYVNTELERTKVQLRNIIGSDVLVESITGTVEGIRIDPMHLGRMVI